MRPVYTARLRGAIYVLHVFQKKSTHGIATPRRVDGARFLSVGRSAAEMLRLFRRQALPEDAALDAP